MYRCVVSSKGCVVVYVLFATNNASNIQVSIIFVSINQFTLGFLIPGHNTDSPLDGAAGRALALAKKSVISLSKKRKVCKVK